MSLQKPLALAALALTTVLAWSGIGHTATPTRWSRPDDLNIGGVHLGMSRTDVRKLGIVPNVKYDATRQAVVFVTGGALREGNSVLVEPYAFYKTALQRLGPALAGQDDRDTHTNFYRAGAHFIIYRYNTPRIDSRSADISEVALAAAPDDIPNGWDRDTLTRTLNSH